jgi:uncharacterized membrane protein
MRVLFICLAVACPIALHLAVLRADATMIAAISVVIAANFVLMTMRKAVPWWLAAGVALAIVAAVWMDPTLADRLAFLPPTLIYVFLCWVFGRTLVAGKEPLVMRIARISRGGDLPEPLARYTRRVTWLWTGVLGAMAVTSFLLARFAAPEIWSLFTNVLSYIVLGLLFPVEYGYRLLRYPHYVHINPLRVAARLAGRGAEIFR